MIPCCPEEQTRGQPSLRLTAHTVCEGLDRKLALQNMTPPKSDLKEAKQSAGAHPLRESQHSPKGLFLTLSPNGGN